MKLCCVYVVKIMFFLTVILMVYSQDPQQEVYYHMLSQSTIFHRFWTAPPTKRIFKNDTFPPTYQNEIKVYCAKNEFEPFQIIVNPVLSGITTVTLPSFHEDIEVILYQVKYVNIATKTDNMGKEGLYPDPLVPLEDGASVTIQANENTGFWIEVNVPSGFSANGDLIDYVIIAGVSIPVRLHVWNFEIPNEIHVKSQMNFNHQIVLQKYSVSGTGDDYWKYVNDMKKFFINHRLTSKSALWPAGVGCCTDYDCVTGDITDPYGIWGFEDQSSKWISGTASEFDGKVFPSYMFMSFQNNDASQDQRPNDFCGSSRSGSDWVGSSPTTPYNTKWFQYIADLADYLNTQNVIDEVYWYLGNEPQDQDDYDAMAWYSQEIKNIAPTIKLMVSEEPKIEIFGHPTYTGAKFDIWLPVLHQYDEIVSWERKRNNNEATWIYFLHGTRPPFFNPITIDKPGMESMQLGLFLWKYRVEGIAYYSMNNWNPNPWTIPSNTDHNGDLFMLYPPAEDNSNIPFGSNGHRLVPSIRLELMRDTLELYEYLYMINSNAHPSVDNVGTTADNLVDKVIFSTKSYSYEDEFVYNLRRVMGQYLAGEIISIPDIYPIPHHRRAWENPINGDSLNYYINFQDPLGEPSSSPLIIDGKTYMKVGWSQFNWDDGYGWYGRLDWVEYSTSSGGSNELQSSTIYCDYGRQKSFHFALPNAEYSVTISVGWEGRNYGHNYLYVNGIAFVDDENNSGTHLVRTHLVTIVDNLLKIDMGIFDEYTMLNYMEIQFTGNAGRILDYPFVPPYPEAGVYYGSMSPEVAIIMVVMIIISIVLILCFVLVILLFGLVKIKWFKAKIVDKIKIEEKSNSKKEKKNQKKKK